MGKVMWEAKGSLKEPGLLRRMFERCLMMASLFSLGLTLSPIPLVGSAIAAPALATLTRGVSDEIGARLMPIQGQQAGQSVTALASGQWLLLGGRQGSSGASNQALVFDPRTGKTTKLDSPMQTARWGHSATLLPDGSVLILGGQGAQGDWLTTAERFDPVSGRFAKGGDSGLLSRRGHTSTLLSDGKLLIAGGIGPQGQGRQEAEIYDPISGRAQAFRASLNTVRNEAKASLLPDGSVLLWGGDLTAGQVTGERYDFATQRFSLLGREAALVWAKTLDGVEVPGLSGSDPAAEGTLTRLAGPLVFRFTERLDMSSLNEQGVTLLGPRGNVQIHVAPAENGLLLFVSPLQELMPGARYTLFAQGARSQKGIAVPLVAVGFDTSSLSAVNGVAISIAGTEATAVSADATKKAANKAPSVEDKDVVAADLDDETWTPSARNYRGEWRSGRTPLADNYPAKRLETLRAHRRMVLLRDGRVKSEERERRLSSLKGAPTDTAGVTALTGQTLKLNGQPLAGVTLRIGNQTVVSDANGEFLMSLAASGVVMLEIDGRSASNAQKQYGRYFYQTYLEPGKVNALPNPVWMTKLDMAHAVKLPSPTTQEIVLTNPKLPGMEVRLPAGTVIRDADGKIVTEVSLTPVPADQTPMPMPYGDIPVYYTLQPGGAVIQSVTGKPLGATVIYPNYSTQPPGATFDLFDHDPAGRGWYIYGKAKVSVDGKRIETDQGFKLYQFQASSAASSGGPPAGNGPNPDGGCDGDPVTCYDGHFLYDHADVYLADSLPLELNRRYRNDFPNQLSFGVGASHDYDMYLYLVNPVGYTVSEIDLVLGSGESIPFKSTGTTNSYLTEIFASTEPGRFYGAKIKGNYYSGFTLTLKDGTVYEFSWYSARLRAIRDVNGNALGIARDGSNRITEIATPNDRHVSLKYESADCSACVTSATDSLGRQTRYQYDSSGRLTQVTDPSGNITRYTYDTAGRLSVLQDPRYTAGQTSQPKVTNVYYTTADGARLNGRVKKQTYADGTTNSFAYTFDSNGVIQKTEVTDERGNVRRLEYTSNARIAKETRAVGKAEQQTETNEWDSTTGLLKSTTDTLGRKTAYEYDAAGNTTKVTRLAGTANAVSTQYTYTATYNQIATITDPLGKVTTLTYDPKGNLTQIKDANGNTKTLGYTASGQLSSITDALGKTAQFDYANGDLVRATDPLGKSTYWSTDGAGRRIAVTDPLGNKSTFSYDALDRQLQRQNALGHSIGYAWDANGNLLRVTDPKTNQHKSTYDSRNALSKQTDPLGNNETYAYDARHNLIQKTDRKGQITKYDYDALNRLIKTTYTDNSTVSYTWDAGNRLTKIVDSLNGTITRSYDNLDRLTQEVTPKGTVGYAYDVADRRKTMAISGQPVLTYTYDAGGRLTRIDQAAGAANNNVAQSLVFTYDARDRRTQTKLANGQTANYTYDAAGQLTGIVWKNAGGTVLGDLAYTYDAAGQRAVIGGSYARSNLPGTKTQNYDAANRLVSHNGQAQTYDANGNLLSDGSNTYTWNARDQLVSISGSVSASFGYDGLGRRMTRTVNGTGSGFVYDGLNLVQELAGTTTNNGTAANVKASYLLGGLDEVFAQQTGTGATAKTYSYLTDALGSVIQINDGTGVKRVAYTYDPYGATTADATFANPYQYTARENDGTGLYYYRARYYSPDKQRFIAWDPIGLKGGINTYAYADNAPTMFTDPMGLKTFMCKKPLHALGGDGARSGPDVSGNPLYHQYVCISDGKGGFICGGQDQRGQKWYDPINGPGKPSNDKYDPQTCEQKEPDNNCIEQCLARKFAGSRPRYGIPFGTDCQEWSDDALKDCQKQCKKK